MAAAGTSTTAVRLLICDDHAAFAESMAAVAQRDPAIAVVAPPVGEAGAAVELCREHRPDVVLMDVLLSGPLSGIDAIARITTASPCTKTLVLTGTGPQTSIIDALEAGAAGFLRKTAGIETILDAIKAVAAGELVFDPAGVAAARHRLATTARAHREAQQAVRELTGREREVLQAIATGRSDKEVGRVLDISTKTVGTHVNNALRKLGVHNRIHAMVIAARAGLIDIGEDPFAGRDRGQDDEQ